MLHRFFNNTVSGVAIVPSTVAVGATLAGATIAKPKDIGRTLVFHLMSAANAGVTVLTVKLQGRIGSGAWEDVDDQKQAGAQAITFDAADTIAGGAMASGNTLKGTVPIDRLSYDDFRLFVATVTGAAATVAAFFEIGDLIEQPSRQKDHFFWKATPYTETAPVATSNAPTGA